MVQCCLEEEVSGSWDCFHSIFSQKQTEITASAPTIHIIFSMLTQSRGRTKNVGIQGGLHLPTLIDGIQTTPPQTRPETNHTYAIPHWALFPGDSRLCNLATESHHHSSRFSNWKHKPHWAIILHSFSPSLVTISSCKTQSIFKVFNDFKF